VPLELDSRHPGFAARFDALVEAKRAAEADVDEVVGEILAEVEARGDAAVIEFTERFDRHSLTPKTMRVGADEIAAAARSCPAKILEALEFAASRIIDYHRRLLPEDDLYEESDGITLGGRWTPIAAVGLYVPGGTAAYPSSVLMNAVPARVAGVPRLVMVVPAPDGRLSPLVLAAASIARIDEIYRVGGAQAVAALAFGTETILPVDKIVGPGSAYVAAAKRQVFGRVGIDMIAGPSEVVIVADGKNDPAWIAADLLAQAEHDPLAQAVLITDDDALAGAVLEAVDDHLKVLPRAEIAAASWQNHGAVIRLDSLENAPALIDRLAPEHLELAVETPEALADQINNAGAIFLGRYTPEAVGDYVGGPNHVLPTSRSARFSSGLSVLDFLKRTSLLRCDAQGLRALGPAAVTLAKAEGLEAHALSVAIRLNKPDEA
jgi:histidinol dehydrogenase